MKKRTILFKQLIVCVVLIICTVIPSGCNSASSSTASQSQGGEKLQTITRDVVEVVYFHPPSRCSGCIYAETVTRYTLTAFFAEELAEGKLTFKTVNLGNRANAATVEHYGAYTSSLFINNIKGGTEQIKEVKEIWFFLGRDEEFISIVKNKVDQCLDEGTR